jgi:hypothetical protein
MTFARLNESMLEYKCIRYAFFISASWQVLELVETVELVNRIFKLNLVHCLDQLQSILILNVILLIRVYLFDFNVLYFCVHEYTW